MTKPILVIHLPFGFSSDQIKSITMNAIKQTDGEYHVLTTSSSIIKTTKFEVLNPDNTNNLNAELIKKLKDNTWVCSNPT